MADQLGSSSRQHALGANLLTIVLTAPDMQAFLKRRMYHSPLTLLSTTAARLAQLQKIRLAEGLTPQLVCAVHEDMSLEETFHDASIATLTCAVSAAAADVPPLATSAAYNASGALPTHPAVFWPVEEEAYQQHKPPAATHSKGALAT